MNCQNFELIVLPLARNQAATAHEQGLAHAEECVRCATLLAEERALLVGVCAVKAEIAHEEAPACVEAALLSAFRAQAEKRAAQASKRPPAHGAWSSGTVLRAVASRFRYLRISVATQARYRSQYRTEASPAVSLPNRWRLGAAWAAALLVILLLGVTWLKLPSGEQKQEVLQSPPINLAPPKDAIAINDGAKVTEQKPVRPMVQRLKPRRIARRAPIPASEATTPFYALVEEGEMAPLESGLVVRVEVPASTLIPFGFPITAETLTQPVQADLLLGQDGLARAIRFLPAGQNTKTQ